MHPTQQARGTERGVRFPLGAHSKPSKLARVAAVTGVAAVAAAAAQVSAYAATPTQAAVPTFNWDPIIKCESGGNPKASNGSHFGLLQFDLRTWHSVGGAGNPMDASPAEQLARANKLLASRGLQPWTASQTCWGGKVAMTSPVVDAAATVTATAPKHASGKEAPAPASSAAPRHAAPETGSYTVNPGDTLSSIATTLRQDWRQVYAANQNVIGGNPDRIFPGQVLAS